MLRKLLRVLFAIVATGVIALALLVGLFRLLVPQVPEYRGELEAWATEALGVPVSVGRIDARWAFGGPELNLYDARVGGQGSGTPELEARQASVGLSIGRLLRERRLAVDRLSLAGTELELARDDEGRWRLQGERIAWLDDADPDARMPVLPDFRLQLEDVRFVYDAGGGAPVLTFDDVSLDLSRRGTQARLEASAQPAPALAGRVALAAEADWPTRPDADWRELPWTLFVEGEDIDVGGWQALVPDGFPVPDAGHGTLRVWAGLTGVVPGELTGDVDFADLRLPGSDDGPPTWQRVSGLFEWQGDSRRWTGAANGLVIERDGRRWPQGDTRIEFEHTDDGEQHVHVQTDHVVLDDLLPLVALLPDGALRDQLALGTPRGTVSELELSAERRDDTLLNYRGRGRVRDGAFDSVDGRPGGSGLGGQFRVDSDGGRFELESSQLVLDLPQSFSDLLAVGSARGLLVWRRVGDGWRVVGDDLHLAGDAFELRGHLGMMLPDDGAAQIELRADLPWVELAPAVAYLPDGHMPSPAVEWLRRGFPGGRVIDGEVRLYGALDRFPFEDDDGEFTITGTLEDVTLDYADDWPLIHDIYGRVRFSGAGLEGEVDSARIADSPLSDGRVRIANLARVRLDIEGRVAGDVERTLAFLRTSPAGRPLERVLDDLDGEGPVTVALALDMPLWDLGQSRWTGTVDFDEVTLSLPPVPSQATRVVGRLSLDTGEVSATGLTGLYAGDAFEADLAPSTREGYHTRLDAIGAIGAQALLEQLGVPLQGRLQGATQWQLAGEFPGDAGDGAPQPVQLEFTSSLRGLGVDLPAPAGKRAAARRPLHTEVLLRADQAAEVTGALGDDTRWHLLIGGDGAGLRRGHVRLGPGALLLPVQDGLIVDGRVAELAVDDWLALGPLFATAEQPREVLRRLSIEADVARGFGQEVSGLVLALARNAAGWSVQLDSERVAGTIRIPDVFDGEAPLELDMQRLHLGARDLMSDSPMPRRAEPMLADAPPPPPDPDLEPDPRALPGLRVDAADFALGDLRLGQLELTLVRVAGGLAATRLSTTSEAFTLSGSGSWRHDEDDPLARTRLVLHLESGDIGATLRQLGYDAVMEASRGEVDVDVNWRGAPFSARWRESVDGTLSVDLRDGRLSDVEPGAGRVFGLMSLQALPRRLALDFRDVFGRGLSFDRIAGDFRLIDGDAYTDNLRLSGPQADVGLVGRTGLATRDYQQQAVVTADAGMTLPAVGGLLGGPGVGAAIFVFQEIFRAPMRGMTQAAYCLSGPWEAPTVKRLGQAELEEGQLCAPLPADWQASN